MAEQLFQIGAKALIKNTKGNILLLYIPPWGGNPGHWDMPGGRLEPGENFEQALRRELQEEIGINYQETPKQLLSFVTNMTIPVNEVRVPLVFVIYEVVLPDTATIKLDADSPEQEYRWMSPNEAAKQLESKCPAEFCELLRS